MICVKIGNKTINAKCALNYKQSKNIWKKMIRTYKEEVIVIAKNKIGIERKREAESEKTSILNGFDENALVLCRFMSCFFASVRK